jgi:tRNA (cytidine/uridine-2'-O-)-methyltransferase
MRIALYQPDIPGNTGALIRLAAGFGVGLDIIEPCGFLFNDKGLRRAGMDYIELAAVVRHPSWEAFLSAHGDKRLVLLTTKGAVPYTDFAFSPDDVLILGRETAGVPDEVHARADAALRIPLKTRSLNVAMAGAIVLAEALRRTKGFPP